MKYFITILTFLFLNCKGKTEYSDTITVDIEQAFNKVQEILLSDFVEHIDYVVLESENPINRYLEVYSTGNYLVCMASSQIYLFDKQTGKFIREIGRYGRGPEEYSLHEYFDGETQRVIADRIYEGPIEYDLNGKMTRTIPRPKKGEGSWEISQKMFLDKNTIVYFICNLFGDTKERLLVADVQGTVLKIFANPYVLAPARGVAPVPTLFYHHRGNTLFFENCVDTIYRVTQEALIPHVHLNLGKYHPPYEKKYFTRPTDMNALRNQYFVFYRIGETDPFLFFDFEYMKSSATSRSSFFGYYNKKQRTVKIADVDHENKRRIVNDIDHFEVVQLLSWTIDEQRNEMISYVDAVDIVEWFEKNPQKAKELPKHLQKLSTLKLDDNPIVVIAKLK